MRPRHQVLQRPAQGEPCPIAPGVLSAGDNWGHTGPLVLPHQSSAGDTGSYWAVRFCPTGALLGILGHTGLLVLPHREMFLCAKNNKLIILTFMRGICVCVCHRDLRI